MRIPRILRREKEISIEELEARLGTVNTTNLRNLTTPLQDALLSKEGISSGFYVVGRFTYRKFTANSFGDIDLIVATNDRSKLIPFHEYPKDAVVYFALVA